MQSSPIVSLNGWAWRVRSTIFENIFLRCLILFSAKIREYYDLTSSKSHFGLYIAWQLAIILVTTELLQIPLVFPNYLLLIHNEQQGNMPHVQLPSSMRQYILPLVNLEKQKRYKNVMNKTLSPIKSILRCTAQKEYNLHTCCYLQRTSYHSKDLLSS